jgi:uncharacterized membrane protein
MPTFLQTSNFTEGGLDLAIGLALYFFLLSIVGWFIEMGYLATARRGLINSGFLQGPVCPAYAVGALIIYPFTLLLAPFPFWVQCGSYVILSTIVEYLAHFSLEKILGIRVWDYSDEFLNFQGRISLKYTFFWFVLVLLLVFVLQPASVFIVESIPVALRLPIAVVFALVFLADIILSAVLFSTMTRRIMELCKAFSLPEAEMKDLQFNRPRIMNEQKRLAKLYSAPAYVELDKAITGKLFGSEEPVRFAFDPGAFGAILTHPKYLEWKDSSLEALDIHRRYLRIAELTFAFCTSQGLRAEAAARGVLFSAYRSGPRARLEKTAAYFFPQRRVLMRIKAAFGEIGPVERDVILRYKWPLNFGPPWTHECLLASFAEKLVQSREFRAQLAALYDEGQAR